MNKLIKLLKVVVRCLNGTTQEKYDARHSLLQTLAVRWGFRVYNRNLAWLSDTEFMNAWEEFPEAGKAIHERRFNLFNLAKLVRTVPGDIAECGVFRGAGSFLMLKANEATDKNFHGFDSFEGLSDPGGQDLVLNEYTFQWKKHDLSIDESVSSSNLRAFRDRIHFYKGWIPTRFKEVEDTVFSLIHIDVDLYEPTRDALEFFYPRLSSGGVVICDDYGSEACPGAKKAMDEYAQSVGLAVVHLTTGQGFFVKP